VRSFILATFITLSIAVSAGCNTVQSPSQQVNDAQITTQVKAKLASDVRASSLTNVHVSTTNGVVTLAGAVENEEVKRSAASVASSVTGVMRVENNLQVAPGPA